jgi:uncharacterized protein (DUF58 family)
VRLSLKISKAGIFYTLITIFIGISAVNTGNNLLYVAVSFLLSFMWLSGVFAKLNLKGLEVNVIPPREGYVRRRTFIKVILRKRGPLPSFLLTLKFKFSPSEKNKELIKKVPFLKKQREFILEFFPEKRGENQIYEVEISSPFPVSFFRRFLRLRMKISFIVFPEPKRCQFFSEDLQRKGEKLPRNLEGFSEFQGLSDYRAGIPKKLISWKAFAKWEVLKRKLFSEEESPVLMIELQKLPLQDLEDKLSCATYLILKAYERGYPFGLKIDGKVIPPKSGEAQKLKILTLLAKYEELK